MAVGVSAGPRGIIGRTDGFFERWIKGWNPYDPAKLEGRGLEPVAVEESKVRKNGARIAIMATVAFLAWALIAPLDSGSVVPGNVVVAGYRKAVQHPTGGVVSRVLVREGESVTQGQVLIQVNPLESEATVASLEQEFINLLVTESRAKAELMGREIVWDPELSRLEPVRVAQAKAVQRQLYASRQAQFGEQVRGLQAQLSGLSGAISSHQVQLDTLSQELGNVEDLAREGYVPKTQLNTVLRTKVEQEAALGTARAEVGRTRSEIAEIRSQYLNEVAKELADVQKGREAVATKLRAARFAESLSEIRAPVAGTVVGLKVFTEGGVIGPGELLLEVVPVQGSLVVEAKVPPSSIDTVKRGQDVDLRFTSFNQSTTPVVRGVVRSIGVDKLKAKPGEEVQEGEDYYLAQVETTPEALAELGDRRLQPGMPVDVVIKNGERTFMSYLIKPLTDKLAKAFKD